MKRLQLFTDHVTKTKNLLRWIVTILPPASRPDKLKIIIADNNGDKKINPIRILFIYFLHDSPRPLLAAVFLLWNFSRHKFEWRPSVTKASE